MKKKKFGLNYVSSIGFEFTKKRKKNFMKYKIK